MTTLETQVSVNRRFARSANVERDHGASAIAGYILTGRALDVADRIGRGLADSTAGRAFSLTGPHGGGKSSLAVFLDALFEPRDTAAHQAAIGLLREADSNIARVVLEGLLAVDPSGRGAVRAFVTSERESVTSTIARALYSAAIRDIGPRQSAVPRSFASPGEDSVLTPADIMSAVRKLAAKRPLVLVIDEFGKNLEAYAEQGRDGDPYLLQELAESAQGDSSLPLTIVTMQHLSFDEYVQETSAARRREWAKVQGRFQDIPYVEAGAQAVGGGRERRGVRHRRARRRLPAIVENARGGPAQAGRQAKVGDEEQVGVVGEVPSFVEHQEIVELIVEGLIPVPQIVVGPHQTKPGAHRHRPDLGRLADRELQLAPRILHQCAVLHHSAGAYRRCHAAQPR